METKFLEDMHDAVFILDENYKILDCNFMAVRWYGYKKAEFTKLNLSDIRAPEERAKINVHMDEVASNEGSTWETVHQRKDGSLFPVEVSSTPMKVGKERRFYHVVRDISDRKKSEQILRESEERYREIVELSPDTIFIHQDGKIVFMNKAGFKLFAATPEQVIGQSVWMLYPPERHGVVRARNQKMLETKQDVPLVEHVMLRLDGKLLNVEAIARYIKFNNNDAFYVIIRDITERKKTNMLLQMQFSVSKELIEATHLVDAATNILKSMSTNLKLSSAKMWIFDQKTAVLRCMAAWSESMHNNISDKMSRQITIQPGQDLPGLAFNQAKITWQGNNNFALPIMHNTEVIGVLEFKAIAELNNDSDVLQAVTAVANQLGAFLKRKGFEKELLYIAKHDPVTGLPNRFLFEETLAFDINIAKSNDQRLAVLFLDISDFSAINEALGHAVGDQVLKTVANRLLELGCAVDQIARFGADQFTIILRNISKIEDVTDFVTKIDQAIAVPLELNAQKLNLSIYAGVSFYPEDSENAQTLLKYANAALNAAKKTGPGSVEFCSIDMNSKAQKRMNVEHDLRAALERQEFLLNYQPIVETPAGIVRGMESLIRWQHNGRFISPAEFIPIAEKSRLIVAIGEWVLHTACAQLKEWNKIYNKALYISVNVSQVQFKNANIAEVLRKVLRDTGLEPGCLKVEITESAIMEDVRKNIATLHEIKELGAKISIDDFGTGYSSLNYLRHLPIDYLKIDQSFIRDLTSNQNDAAIVRTIVDLARNLGYKVIAEGVETEAQLRFLNDLGCYEIQGYYFSRPMAVEEATLFLRQDKLL